MVNDKVLSMIGLACKAGKLVSGEFAVEKSVKCGKASVVVLAGDVSENTKKKFTNMCAYYKVPLYMHGTKESLGRATGREYRASIAIQDEGFKKAIMKLVDSSK